MRAVVLEGAGAVSVQDVPDAGLLGPDSAVVRVDATAICGSDLHLYHGHGGAPGTRLGHEFVGTVEEVGPDVRNVSRGDRVLVSGVVGCGHCPDCLARDPGVCRNNGLAVFGTGALHGGQAEAVSVPGIDVFSLVVPEALTTEQAVLLTDILPTGFLGARRADIRPGSTVVVIGAGPVGVLAAQCAQLFGPARVLVVDKVADRLERAARLGAEPVDASAGDTVALVQELTGGRGAESVIEAVGADQTVSDAIMCAAPGGTISVIGVNLGMAFPFPMALALMRRLTFRVTLASIPGTWDSLVPLIASGRLHPEDVFTHRLPLSAAAEAYRIFDSRTDGVLKVLLDPAG
ncbi:MAG TPA: alcohol dehydrogenase catalytic domain-containing protein [Acidimicrobiales bacterium]|nr:alcohol dehydrogenase catalytic domain-containing protein [Acidimicrobiales bacterium]